MLAPTRQRPRGRERIYAASAKVQDPYNQHMWFSGLTLLRMNPGQPAACALTVSHSYVLNYNGDPTVSFTGVLLDSNGLVISLLSVDTISLVGGDYVLATLYSERPVPDSQAGKTITVIVGDVLSFTGAIIGQPFPQVGGTIMTSGQVPAKASGGSTIPQSGFPWLDVAAVGGGGAVLLGGMALVAHRRATREPLY